MRDIVSEQVEDSGQCCFVLIVTLQHAKTTVLRIAFAAAHGFHSGLLHSTQSDIDSMLQALV